MIDRRRFLRGAIAQAALSASASLGCSREPAPPPDDGWDAGEVAHLLPTVGPDRILLKASFLRPQSGVPVLETEAARASGVRTDSAGRFFTFDIRGLEPARRYTLRLVAASGAPLCDAWPLSTFPAADSEPGHFRLLVYTCAGGPDRLFGFGVVDAYLRVALRQRLFARALSLEPDAVVANGDHVYWDLKSRFGWAMGRSPQAWVSAGHFDRASSVLGTANEGVLIRAFGPQIADLYGVRFRSVPVFFLQDDHDYGENDEASETLRTFPPDPFMIDLARSTQRLYYPELIDGAGLLESHGTLRYGRLFEALLYDCRRALTNALDPALGHDGSAFVPAEVERWLVERSRRSPCHHLAHMPSTPVLWTAGKWGEWYPDFKDEAGVLGIGAVKPYWPAGWGGQHDRLLDALSARRDRTPLFISGDLHATAAGRILASRGRSYEENPPVSILSGAIGTGDFGWPSRFRGQIPVPSATLEAEEWRTPLEKNGFSIVDVTPQALRVSFFGWSSDQGEEAIDGLEPFRVIELPRPG